MMSPLPLQKNPTNFFNLYNFFQNFQPVAYPKKDYGKFYTGDSYIVLYVGKIIPQKSSITISFSSRPNKIKMETSVGTYTFGWAVKLPKTRPVLPL